MRRHERLTRAQMLMAANAPILAKAAMTDGDPVHGYLPSGTVAGAIDDRPTCAELIERIVAEAEATLARLGRVGEAMPIEVHTEAAVTEVVLNHPPVNALDSHGWFELAETSGASAATSRCASIVLAPRGAASAPAWT